MVALVNSAEGGTLAAAVTSANSGGASGTPWDVVSVGGTGAITYDNTQVNSGALSYKIVGDTTANTLLNWDGLGTVPEAWGRVYLYLTAVPASSVACVWVRNASSNVTRVRINTAGKVEITDGANAVILTSTTSVATGQWIRLEWHVIALATNGTAEVRLFNTASSTTPTETLASTTASLFGNLTRVSYGRIATTNPPTLWLDDLVANTEGWPGPESQAITGADSAALTEARTTDAAAAATDSATAAEIASVGGDGTDVEDYLSGSGASALTLTTGPATQAGSWLLAIQMWDAGDGAPAAPAGTAGQWEILAQADAGTDQAKVTVSASCVTVTGAQAVTFPGPAAAESHAHLYVLSGTRPYEAADRVFEATATSSRAAAASHAAPSIYSPDDRGLLICAWAAGSLSATPVNYTVPAAMNPRTEVDGATMTSRAAEQSLTVYGGTGARTATASAPRGYAAASVVVRPDSGSITWPGQPMRKRIALALGVNPGLDPDAWADNWETIPNKTYARDPITITRGRADEAATVDASSCSLTFDNTGGEFSRLNPLSPYYGRLRKNTPLRVWINLGDGWELRVTAQVAEWPPRSAAQGVDEYMSIVAAGILRRLNRGKTLPSALYRAVTRAATPYAAYWSLEDGADSTRAASGVPGGAPMSVAGPVKFGSDATPAGAAAAVAFDDGGGRLSGAVIGMSNSPGGWLVSFWLDAPLQDDAAAPFAAVDWSTPGATSWQRYLLMVGTTDSGTQPGCLFLGRFPEPSGAGVIDLVGLTDLRGAGPVQVTMVATQQSPTNIGLTLYVNGQQDAVALITDTAGPVTSIRVSNGNGFGLPVEPSTSAAGGITGLIVTTPDRVEEIIGPLYQAGRGWAGETAADRITRLSAEEGIPVTIVGQAEESEPMGPQPAANYLTIVREAEAADGGVLYETRYGRLAYQTRAARYNAPIALEMDYAAGHIPKDQPLEPTDDDQRTQNDVEISRTGGSTARVVDQAHVDEVGLYDDGSATLNVHSDDVLASHASWRVHMGTFDDLRYPSVSPALMARPELVPGWLGVDVGHRFTIANPPRDQQPGLIDLFAEGYSETLGIYEWAPTANTSPASPWRVAVLDDTVLGRLNTDGSELSADVGADDTTLSVAITAGPQWVTDPAWWPFDIVGGGEVMTVTAITGTSSPQTFTVIRAVNGIVKPHAAGTDVRLAQPMIPAL